MAEENSNLNTQRPIGIKPITIKPMQPPAQNLAPAPAESAAEAPTIKPLSINVGPTAGKSLDGVNTNATIRLKPVISLNQTGVLQSPPSASPIQPMRPQTIQPTSIRPSIIPTPDAAKSKTARISLDSALGETPALQNLQVGGIIPPAPVGKITSNLTADSLSINKGQTAKVSLPLQSPESEITRRRTLRVKAAATSSPESKPVQEESSSEAPTIKKKKSFVFKKDKAESEASAASLNDAANAPAGEGQISAFSAFQTAPVAKTNPVFPIFAFVAAFVIIALSVLYMSQACGPDRSLTAFSSFLGMPSPSWPGKVLTF